MKKLLPVIAIFVGLMAGLVAYAAQDTTLDERIVRDPNMLEAYLEANASDAQTRIAALEGSLGTNPTLGVTVGSLTTTGIVTISEGKLADSTIVGADIKADTITTNNVSAAMRASLALADSALQAGATNLIAGGVGWFNVLGGTQLVFIVGGGATTNTVITW
jgi:hypothetical protein